MRIGLVGYGMGGQCFHAPFIAAAEGTELAGVVARAPATIAKVEADFPGMPVYPSSAVMIEAGGVEVVTITTPPHTRRDLVLEAIDAGLHVIADKPFAPSAEAARDLEAAAKAKGVVLGVFHNRRWDADALTLRKVLDSGRAGRLWRLHSRMEQSDPGTLEAGAAGVCCATSAVTSSIRPSGSSVRSCRSMRGSTWSICRRARPTPDSCMSLHHGSGVSSYIEASKLNRLARQGVPSLWRVLGQLRGVERRRPG